MKESELGKLYKDGEIICREGDEGDSMYVLQAGKVEIIKKVSDGELSMRTLNAGELFGEMALFDRMPRSATVRAVGEARVLSIDKKGFFSRASKDPTLAFNILESMSKRIRILNDEFVKLKKEKEKILTSFVDLKETCKLVLDEIRHSIKSDNGSIMLLDEKRNILKIVAAFGTEASKKTELRAGAGIAGDVVKTGKIELINNISADLRFEKGEAKVETLLCAPLKSKNKIFGVVNLSNSRGNYFNLDDLNLMRVLAIYASIAIENARLFSMTERMSDTIIRHATLLDMG